MNETLHTLQDRTQSALLATRIVRSLSQGTVRRSQYRAYLVDVHAYACHSPQVIGLAATRLASSHPALASYLFVHAGEELGHDRWAADDLQDLGVDAARRSALPVSSPCLRMIGLEYLYAAHLNPVGLFGWMFVLESLGGSIGGRIAHGLDQALGLEGRALRFLAGHGQADAQHARELFAVISAHVQTEADLAVFHRVASESAELYVSILDAAFDAPGP
jgi:heme oxygenase